MREMKTILLFLIFPSKIVDTASDSGQVGNVLHLKYSN